jgi:hypothetical protein
MVWGRFSSGKIYGLGPTDGFGRTDGRAGSPGGRAVIWGFGTADGRIWAGRTEDLGRTDRRIWGGRTNERAAWFSPGGRAVIREGPAGRLTSERRTADRRT